MSALYWHSFAVGMGALLTRNADRGTPFPRVDVSQCLLTFSMTPHMRAHEPNIRLRRLTVALFAVRAANFDEFSTCANAEAILGRVVRVSVVVAPLGILLIVHMPIAQASTPMATQAIIAVAINLFIYV